jgi:hypothetical protein
MTVAVAVVESQSEGEDCKMPSLAMALPFQSSKRLEGACVTSDESSAVLAFYQVLERMQKKVKKKEKNNILMKNKVKEEIEK